MKVLVLGTVLHGEQIKSRDKEGKEVVSSVRHKTAAKPAGQFENCRPIEVDDEQAMRLIDGGSAIPADPAAIKALEKAREKAAREARAEWPDDDAEEQVKEEVDTEGQQGEGSLKPPSVPARGHEGEPRLSDPTRKGGPGVETAPPPRR